MEQPRRLADGEYRFAALVWANEPLSSGQLVRLAADVLGWKKSTTYTVLRRLCHKGATANEEATVTPLVTREEVLKAQGEELSRQAGGLSPFLTAFFSGRRLTQNEAEELKKLIDQHTWEG